MSNRLPRRTFLTTLRAAQVRHRLHTRLGAAFPSPAHAVLRAVTENA